MPERFTSGRVPDPGIEALFATQSRWQAWLEVESALALSQAEMGLIPQEAADAIARKCRVECLDADRIRGDFARMSHPLMPLIVGLSNAVEDGHGGWVHWGATTQNITQTGDLCVAHEAHGKLLRLVGEILGELAGLAESGAEMVMAGRTHGQHAVPITFGFKVAGWINEFGRHVERLRELEDRAFVALVGGAAGTFASLGEEGPELQRRIAERLGLRPIGVASRSAVDFVAELVSALGLLGATCGKIAREVYSLMKTEVGEAEEPVPAGTVGSSTMPQKRNPQLCQDVLGIAAELRALVPLTLEMVQSEHEADHTPSVAFDALARSMTLAGDALIRIRVIAGGLRLNPGRMAKNLEMTGGMINAEALMLELGRTLGRQVAHDVVYEASHKASEGDATFEEVLARDPRITECLSAEAVSALLDPARHTGLSAAIAREQAAIARRLSAELA